VIWAIGMKSHVELREGNKKPYPHVSQRVRKIKSSYTTHRPPSLYSGPFAAGTFQTIIKEVPLKIKVVTWKRGKVLGAINRKDIRKLRPPITPLNGECVKLIETTAYKILSSPFWVGQSPKQS
jgi:hypothetical protein